MELGEAGGTPLSACGVIPRPSLLRSSAEGLGARVLGARPFTVGKLRLREGVWFPGPPSPKPPAVAPPVSVADNWGRCASARDPRWGSRAASLSLAACSLSPAAASQWAHTRGGPGLRRSPGIGGVSLQTVRRSDGCAPRESATLLHCLSPLCR